MAPTGTPSHRCGTAAAAPNGPGRTSASWVAFRRADDGPAAFDEGPLAHGDAVGACWRIGAVAGDRTWRR